MSLQDYIKQITDFPLLSAEEEIRLFRSLKEKEKAAEAATENALELAAEITSLRNKIIKSNLRLVISIAQKISHTSNLDEIVELVDEGNLGLMEAIDRFDPELGFKFSTYAFWWIRQRIKAAIMTHRATLSASLNLYNLAYRIKKYLSQSGRNFVDIKEAAEFLKVPEEKVKVALPLLNKLVYLDEPAFQEDDQKMSLGDRLISPHNSIEEKEVQWLHAFISDFLENNIFPALQEKEVFTLKNRYGINPDRRILTLKEIGEKLNLTAERVRQLEKEALKKIRKMNVIYILQDLLSYA